MWLAACLPRPRVKHPLKYTHTHVNKGSLIPGEYCARRAKCSSQNLKSPPQEKKEKKRAYGKSSLIYFIKYLKLQVNIIQNYPPSFTEISLRFNAPLSKAFSLAIFFPEFFSEIADKNALK